MHIVVIALTVIVSLLLIGIVLIQKSKGGGLSSQFGGAGSVMGVRQANSFLEKGTWTLVAILVVLSIVSVWITPKAVNASSTRTAPVPVAPAPALPAPGAVQTVELPAPAPEAAAAEAAEAPAATEVAVEVTE